MDFSDCVVKWSSMEGLCFYSSRVSLVWFRSETMYRCRQEFKLQTVSEIMLAVLIDSRSCCRENVCIVNVKTELRFP